MGDFRRGEEHRGRVGTCGDARAASDAGGRVKRGFGRILGNEDRVGLRCATGGSRNEAAGLNNSIEWRPIASQIAEDGKCAGAPGFKSHGIAIVKETHGKLADRGAAPASMSHSIDQKTACAADSLAAIVLESYGRFTLGLKVFIE